MRIKIFWGTLMLLMLNVVTLFAQTTDPGEPCAGTDVDTNCPLDTWVMVLAVIAVAFAAIHLHRKQQRQAQTR